MKENKDSMSEGHFSQGNRTRKTESHRVHYHKDVMPGSELWTDGLICAFELVREDKKLGPKSSTKGLPPNEIVKSPVCAYRLAEVPAQRTNRECLLDSTSLFESRKQEISPADGKMDNQSSPGEKLHNLERIRGSHWMPIGWARISELVQTVQADFGWSTQQFDLIDDEDDLTVADLAAPYWESPAGPIWWCHVTAGHPSVDAWLSNAPWLHPTISVALRDEGRLKSEKMKHLLYEVPVRVAGGLLFELLGQSVGDPYVNEASKELFNNGFARERISKKPQFFGYHRSSGQLLAGGYNALRTVHEVIAHLASCLARWDARLFRKLILGAANEVELKFVNREEIELQQHLRGNTTRILLQGIRKSTREMIEEKEAVRGRLFTIQDVMQSNLHSWLQVCLMFNRLGGIRASEFLIIWLSLVDVALFLTIITGLFGINMDRIPGAQNTPYAFGLFSVLLVILGVVLIAVGLLYLRLKKPISEKQVEIRKLELQELVNMFQHEVETHAQVS